MSKSQAERIWVLLLRAPESIEEDNQLLMYGSSAALCRQRIFPDCCPLMFSRLMDRVQEDHRKHGQPFQAIMVDTFHPLKESELARLTWILRHFHGAVPVILVLRNADDEISLGREVNVFVYDRETHTLPIVSVPLPDEELPRFLIEQLASQ